MFIIYTVTPLCSATDNPCDDDYDKERQNQFKCRMAYTGSPEHRNSLNLPATKQVIAKDKFILDCIKDLTEYHEQYCKANTQSFLQDNEADSDEDYAAQDDDTSSDEISVLEVFATLAIASANEDKCEEAYIGSSDQQRTSKLATTERAIAKEKFIMDCVGSLTEFQLEYVEDQLTQPIQ